MKARAFGRALRLLIAAALTAYVLYKSHPAAVLHAAANANAGWILASVLLVLVDRTLMAWRWISLLCIVEAPRPPLGRLLRIFFVSTFVGTFLPASIGGDAVRAYSVSREGVSGPDAVASVFMDRMIGVASLLIMALAGLLLARDLASNRIVLAALGLTAAACALTMAAIFSERIGAWLGRVITIAPVMVLRRLGHATLASVQRYARFHRSLAGVLASSVAVQILRVVQAYCLGRAVGIDAGAGVYFAYVPLILLVMLLPVTINGLGTSQAAFVWFFARAGVGGALAFALSVLFVGLGIVGNLPGGLLYARREIPRATGS